MGCQRAIGARRKRRIGLRATLPLDADRLLERFGGGKYHDAYFAHIQTYGHTAITPKLPLRVE